MNVVLRDKKCNRCKCWRKQDDFISNERVVKCCVKCREATKKYNKQHYQENKEKKAEKQKQNKQKIAEYQKKYNEEHKQEKAEYQKQHYQENKEKITEKQKQYKEEQKKENPLHIKFLHMIQGSKTADKKSNRTYNEEDFITEDFLNELWVKQNGLCFYEICECKLTLEFNRNSNQISIQRLNNELPHIQSNCVLSCFKCNVSNMENEKLYKKMVERTKQYQ